MITTITHLQQINSSNLTLHQQIKKKNWWEQQQQQQQHFLLVRRYQQQQQFFQIGNWKWPISNFQFPDFPIWKLEIGRPTPISNFQIGN